MNITAKMVADLREKTGAGMMDCKKALVAANGDMEAAIENLRKSGIAKAEKKSGRSTNQGKVWTGVCEACKSGAMVEVLCETDFAAKTDRFGQLATDVATAALKAGGDGCVTEAVNEAAKETLTNAIATIGENMQIRRAVRYQDADNSTFATYHHMDGRSRRRSQEEHLHAHRCFLPPLRLQLRDPRSCHRQGKRDRCRRRSQTRRQAC